MVFSNSLCFTCFFLKVTTKDEKMLHLIDKMIPILQFECDIKTVKSFISRVYYVKFSIRFSGILTGHQTSECVNIASPKAVRWEDGTNWSFEIKVMLMLNVGENPPHQMRGTEHIPVSKQHHSRKQHWLADKWYCKLPSWCVAGSRSIWSKVSKKKTSGSMQTSSCSNSRREWISDWKQIQFLNLKQQNEGNRQLPQYLGMHVSFGRQ